MKEIMFSSADRVQDVIKVMLDADKDRRANRALITEVFDGHPPYSDAEAEELNVENNVNFLEGAMIVHDARNQLRNGFMKAGNHFTITVDGYQNRVERERASRYITSCINRPLRESMPYHEMLKSQFANVVLHALGPAQWAGRDGWNLIPLGINDVLVPDKTYSDFTNLTYFATYKEWSPSQFMRLIEGDGDRWNRVACMKLLKEVVAKIEKAEPDTGEDLENYWNPERILERLKENVGYYNTSAVPSIRTWMFYCQSLDGKAWYRYVVPADPQMTSKQFLFRDRAPYAKSHEEIIHFQLGNVSNKAPFRLHSLRSLGFLLQPLVEMQNKLRARQNDAIFENLLWYFQIPDVSDKDQINSINLHHLGIIPTGVNVVGREMRHVPDMQLQQFAIAQNRQLMGEAAMSFRGNPTGSDQQQLQESAVSIYSRMTAAQHMVIAILGSAYDYAKIQQREIARRFANASSSDPDIKNFQQKMNRYRVDAKWLDPKRWQVEPVRTLGGGNKLMEMAQASILMSIRSLLDPDSQRKVTHLYVSANTDDPGLADELVPLEANRFPSRSVIEGQQSASVALQALPIGIPKEVNRNEYIAACLQALITVVDQIEKSTQVPSSVEQLRGMMNLSVHIQQNLDIIAEDGGQKELVARFNVALARANNMIRAFGQRLAEKMKAEGGPNDAETRGRIQKDLIVTQAKAVGKLKAQDASEQRKQIAFINEQAREQAEFEAELARKQAELQTDLQNDQTRAIAESITAVRRP